MRKLLDGRSPDGGLWQLRVIWQNLGDPRLERGFILLVSLWAASLVGTAHLAHWWWTLPLHQPQPEEQDHVG